MICVWVNCWAKKGILEMVFLRLQQLEIIQIQVNVIQSGFHLYQGASRWNECFEKSDT